MLSRIVAEAQAKLDQIEKIRCEDSLLYFFERAWLVLDKNPLKVNWHHSLVAEKLQSVTFGEIRNLMINQPPRTTKTQMVSVVWPAWCWIQPEERWGFLAGPHVKFLCVSYGATLAETIGQKMLDLVQSDWFRGRWGDKIVIRPDRSSRADFANTAGGERISNSVHGALLGRGGSAIVIDDPHDPEGAESAAERQTTVRAFAEGLPTRVTDPEKSVRVMVMQRLHEDDCSGHALAQMEKPGTALEDMWEHLCFPMRYEPDRGDPNDPRIELGELLWPEFWTEAAVRNREMEMGPYSVAGQFQQRPEPRGGGLFKRSWLEPWPPLGQDGSILDGWVKRDGSGRRGIVYPALEYVVAWVDTAFTAKQENDFSAMAIVGLFRSEGKGQIERRPDGSYMRVPDEVGFPKAILLYGWEKHLELRGSPQEPPPGVSAKEWNGPIYRKQRQESWGLVEWVIDSCRRYKADYLGIETQGQGHGLEQELRRQHASEGKWSVELVPTRTDKIAKAYAVQHIFSSKQVYVPQYEDGAFPEWLSPLLNEFFMFPKARHDDFTDAFVSCLQHLRDRGLLSRREEYDAFETDLVSYDRSRPVVMPYPV